MSRDGGSSEIVVWEQHEIFEVDLSKTFSLVSVKFFMNIEISNWETVISG